LRKFAGNFEAAVGNGTKRRESGLLRMHVCLQNFHPIGPGRSSDPVKLSSLFPREQHEFAPEGVPSQLC
jgi:hypothetical protein